MKNLVLIEENLDGFAYVISKPSNSRQIFNIMDIRGACIGYSYKVISIKECRNHKNLMGKNYLTQFIN